MGNLLSDNEWEHIEKTLGTKFENLQDLVDRIKSSGRVCDICHLIYCKILAMKLGFWMDAHFESEKWNKIGVEKIE